jgi:hypothetical protein
VRKDTLVDGSAMNTGTRPTTAAPSQPHPPATPQRDHYDNEHIPKVQQHQAQQDHAEQDRDLDNTATPGTQNASAIKYHLEADRNPTFTCPSTAFPNLIWLRGPHKSFILDHFFPLLHDDSTMFVVFSNKPAHLAKERQVGGKPFMGKLTNKEEKIQRLPVLLGHTMGESEELEIVVTNLGGEGVSGVLKEFAAHVRSRVEREKNGV